MANCDLWDVCEMLDQTGYCTDKNHISSLQNERISETNPMLSKPVSIDILTQFLSHTHTTVKVNSFLHKLHILK